ncbi:MAG: hypothetical protein ACLRRT_15130 [Ruthenibacterium lactatiformans]
MTRILFVCHGNIRCSPMAEFVFREMAENGHGVCLFHAASAATSGEELGNPVHQGTREKLQAVGISCADKRAVRLRPDDYRAWDRCWAWIRTTCPTCGAFWRRPERRMVAAGLLRSPP